MHHGSIFQVKSSLLKNGHFKGDVFICEFDRADKLAHIGDQNQIYSLLHMQDVSLTFFFAAPCVLTHE